MTINREILKSNSADLIQLWGSLKQGQKSAINQRVFNFVRVPAHNLYSGGTILLEQQAKLSKRASY